MSHGTEITANVLAVRMVARALDNAVTVDVAHIAEACGLPEGEVQHLVDTMRARRARDNAAHTRPPQPTPVTPPPAAAKAPKPASARTAAAGQPSSIPPPADTTAPDDAAALLAWALTHPDPRIRDVGEKTAATLRRRITGMLAAARKRALQAAEREAANKEKAAKQTRIAALRAELDELTGPPRVPCPDCGDPIRPNRLAVHRARSRKHREAANQETSA